MVGGMGNDSRDTKHASAEFGVFDTVKPVNCKSERSALPARTQTSSP